MSLRWRLTLQAALLAALLLAGAFGLALWWQQTQQARVESALLALQRSAWQGVEAGELARLAQQAQALAAAGPLVDALDSREPADQPVALQAEGGGRLDLLDRQGRLRFTTSLSVTQALPMLDVASVRRVLAGETLRGIVPVSGGAFSFVVAQPVRAGGAPDGTIVGAVTVGASVEPALAALSQSLGGPVAFFNLRRHAVAGDGRALFARLAPAVSVQHEGLVDASDGPSHYQVATLAVAGHDGRLVGGVASLHDETAATRRSRWVLAATVALALSGIVAALAGLRLRLRAELAPLGCSVEALTALSRGDTSVRLDLDRHDEAGRIAEGVERLRGEMMLLETLREERQREMRRQERVIRDELRALAGTLDSEGREEVMAELETALRPGRSDTAARRLAVLATVLRGLSSRIRIQQQRLLDLLGELQEAMRMQEAFATLQRELEIARRMQLSILPQQLPAVDGVSIASLILPAREVGGDFYDYFELDEHRLGVVVADVSGKGVPAAFFMAIARTLLKATAAFVDSPAEALAAVNQRLAAENDEMMFVTVFYGVLDQRSGEFTYAVGGHNPPVLRRADGGTSLLPSPRGMALAVEPSAVYENARVRLDHGDVLVLYTDGVTEANDPSGALFGERALLDALAACPRNAPAHAYPRRIAKVLEQFVKGGAQADDITCVALRHGGDEAPIAPEPIRRGLHARSAQRLPTTSAIASSGSGG